MRIFSIIKKTCFLIRNNPKLLLVMVLGKTKMFFAKLFGSNNQQPFYINGVRFSFASDTKLPFNEVMEKRLSAYEPAIVKLMKHYLKKGDIFFDIGANIGYLTVVGASLVGKEGEVHSFEPVPQYAKDVDRIKKENPEYKIFSNTVALGEKEETLTMTAALPPFVGNSSFFAELVDEKIQRKTITVPVIRLDDYIAKNTIVPEKIGLLKIDVEGFEFQVLKGMSSFFNSTTYRPAIISEIKPFVYKTKNGLRELQDYMASFGYSAFRIDAPKISVNLETLVDEINVIFK